MTKPILIIRTPIYCDMQTLQRTEELLKNKHADLISEYHIIMAGGKSDLFEFEALHPGDFKITDFEEAKRKIGDSLLDVIK